MPLGLTWWDMSLLGLLLVVGLLGVNAAILILALKERWQWRALDKWLTSDQVLENVGTSEPTIIMVHGLVGSPFDWQPLANALQQHGYRVVVPAVPAQTARWFAYTRGSVKGSGYVSWLSGIVERERNQSRRDPILIGFSLGASICVVADCNVGKLIMVAPFFSHTRLGRLLQPCLQVLRWLVPVVPKLNKGKIDDADGYRRYMPGSYFITLSALVQLLHVAKRAADRLPTVRCPLLTIASRGDRVAAFDATERLLKHYHMEAPVEVRGNHMLMYDRDSERLTSEVVSFLRQPQAKM